MTTELAAEVRRRANHRCEYCRLPQDAFRRLFHVEHIIAKQHGGETQVNNLALGLTPTGRATVRVLGMNDEMRRILRYELWREGLFAW